AASGPAPAGAAPVTAPVMPGWCRRADEWLVLTEARNALGMEIRIGDRPALLAHPRLAESGVCFQQPIVAFALDHVPPRRPGGRHVARVGLRAVRAYLAARHL